MLLSAARAYELEVEDPKFEVVQLVPSSVVRRISEFLATKRFAPDTASAVTPKLVSIATHISLLEANLYTSPLAIAKRTVSLTASAVRFLLISPESVGCQFAPSFDDEKIPLSVP